jgi:uncharacterized membrane protein
VLVTHKIGKLNHNGEFGVITHFTSGEIYIRIIHIIIFNGLWGYPLSFPLLHKDRVILGIYQIFNQKSLKIVS